jgi:hypothetical protein
MHAILAEFELPSKFSVEVDAAANAISDKIPTKNIKTVAIQGYNNFYH